MNKKTIQLALWILLGLTIIDILNVPSIVINQIPLNFEEFSLVGLIIIIGVLLGISYVQWFKTIRTKILEMTDRLTIVLLSIVIFYGIINIIPGFELTVFKFQLLCIPAIMLVCIIALLQMRKQFPDSEASGDTLQTVFDLHDLNDEIKFANWNPEQFILLKETPDTVDLLNRKQTIVPELKRTITNCYYPDGGFVVALTGSWGCGKTTVINLVTKELEGLTIINDFSFWEYENKEALVKAVIERLLEESDSVLNFLERQAFIQSVLEMVSDKSGFNFQRLFAMDTKVSDLKARIGSHLIENNKRILFVVDDLERTNSEIAVMIFKVIATVLDIGNVIYLVSYDEVEMKKHFSTVGIEFNYLDKVINQKFTLPQISETNLADETKKAMRSLARIYHRENELTSVIDEVAKLLPVENIRDLKRMLNSLMPYIQKNELGLNERDRLLINYIKFKDNELWYMLAGNGNYLANFYYVDSRKSKQRQEHNVSKGFNPDKETDFEHRRTEWIEKIKIEYDKYNEVLALLFNNFEITEEYTLKNKSNREINILNGRYFDYYFSDESNRFITTTSSCKKFFDSIGKSEQSSQIFRDILNENYDFQNVIGEFFIDQIFEYKQNNVAVLQMIFSNLGHLNPIFIEKIEQFCALVLMKYGDSEELGKIVSEMTGEKESFYFHTKIIKNLIYNEWSKKYIYEISEESKLLIEQYKENISRMFSNVWINESITQENLQAMTEIFLEKDQFWKLKTESEWKNWFQGRITENNCLVFLERLYYSAFDVDNKFDFEKYDIKLQELGISDQLAQLDIDAMKNNYSTKENEDILKLSTLNRYQDFIKQQEKGTSS